MAAANTDKLRKQKSNFGTTLSSGITVDETNIPLASVQGLATDTAVTLTIDRVDVNGTATDKPERVTGVISGSALTNSLRAQDSTTASTHDSGAVVEEIWDADSWNDMVDWGLVDHNQDGTHKTSLALTTPKITTSINDSAGNELIKVTATGSAVNELTLANAAANNNPVLSATGGSDNIGITLTPKGTGKITISANDLFIPTAGNIQPNGADPVRGMYVPSNAMFPATTNGCASLAQVESSTNKVNYKVLDFDKASDEYACFSIPAPKWWDLGTITAEFYWTAASSTGDAIWALQGVALSNDDAIDTAYGTAVTVTDTLTAAGDVCVTAATAAITVGGTPAKADNLYFRVYRDADAGGDTLDADARLLGVVINFTMAQYNDA